MFFVERCNVSKFVWFKKYVRFETFVKPLCEWNTKIDESSAIAQADRVHGLFNDWSFEAKSVVMFLDQISKIIIFQKILISFNYLFSNF